MQRLLGQDLAAAPVAIQPAPIRGVVSLAPSTARAAWIAIRNPANRHRALSLAARQFRYAFGNVLSATESDELYERWTIPSPGRPLFELVPARHIVGAWVEFFRAAGYAPVAPGWPGEASTVGEAREHPGQVAGKGIDDIVAHYAQLIRGLDTRPILIGHSRRLGT